MSLQLSLHLPATTFLPGQEVRPVISVENPAREPVPAPALDGQGESRILFRLHTPDGASYEFAMPGDTGAPPASSATLAPLPPRQNRLRLFALPTPHPNSVWPPGEYRLVAELHLDGVTACEIGWFQEGPGQGSVALPAARSQRTPGPVCYQLFHGERLHALYRYLLRFDPDNSSPALRVYEPVPCCPVGPQARDLAAAEDWVAWLEPTTLHAAIDVHGCRVASFPLPFSPLRVLSLVPESTAGLLDVLLAADDGVTLAVVRFFRPVPLTPPQDPGNAEPDPGDSDAEEPVDEDQDDLASFFPVETRPPLLLWTYRAPAPFHSAVLAPGAPPHSLRRSLVVLTQNPDGGTIHYALLEDGHGPQGFHPLALADARFLPATLPALTLDADHRAHLALLLQSSSIEGHPTVVVARTSFSADGQPRLDRSTSFHEEATLPDAPVGGAVSLFAAEPSEPWYIDWALLLTTQQCLLSSRFGPARLLAPADGVSLPLSLTSTQERAYLCARSTAAIPVFLE